MTTPTRTLGILLYEDFELLDVFGPVEMFAYVGDELRLLSVAEKAGAVRVAASSEGTNFDRIPTSFELDLDPAADYVHITTNNTIFGNGDDGIDKIAADWSRELDNTQWIVLI